ncbi:hypothetical protein, variant [Fonticula alba]|uniref:Uncharacterized protein n=1 Tax=Fonticula alba TaxID=691883 RepID=A0A058Z5R5_FONAL|nr:hypothetical protein, variant [Fonticula alba]KCV69283.1 hypothetical protein, variant [Fonticula alba]|eukprot:XP_009495848.1 hypothetical protein, variant [Fonticula alba]
MGRASHYVERAAELGAEALRQAGGFLGAADLATLVDLPGPFIRSHVVPGIRRLLALESPDGRPNTVTLCPLSGALFTGHYLAQVADQVCAAFESSVRPVLLAKVLTQLGIPPPLWENVTTALRSRLAASPLRGRLVAGAPEPAGAARLTPDQAEAYIAFPHPIPVTGAPAASMVFVSEDYHQALRTLLQDQLDKAGFLSFSWLRSIGAQHPQASAKLYLGDVPLRETASMLLEPERYISRCGLAAATAQLLLDPVFSQEESLGFMVSELLDEDISENLALDLIRAALFEALPAAGAPARLLLLPASGLPAEHPSAPALVDLLLADPAGEPGEVAASGPKSVEVVDLRPSDAVLPPPAPGGATFLLLSSGRPPAEAPSAGHGWGFLLAGAGVSGLLRAAMAAFLPGIPADGRAPAPATGTWGPRRRRQGTGPARWQRQADATLRGLVRHTVAHLARLPRVLAPTGLLALGQAQAICQAPALLEHLGGLLREHFDLTPALVAGLLPLLAGPTLADLSRRLTHLVNDRLLAGLRDVQCPQPAWPWPAGRPAGSGQSPSHPGGSALAGAAASGLALAASVLRAGHVLSGAGVRGSADASLASIKHASMFLTRDLLAGLLSQAGGAGPGVLDEALWPAGPPSRAGRSSATSVEALLGQLTHCQPAAGDLAPLFELLRRCPGEDLFPGLWATLTALTRLGMACARPEALDSPGQGQPHGSDSCDAAALCWTLAEGAAPSRQGLEPLLRPPAGSADSSDPLLGHLASLLADLMFEALTLLRAATPAAVGPLDFPKLADSRREGHQAKLAGMLDQLRREAARAALAEPDDGPRPMTLPKRLVDATVQAASLIVCLAVEAGLSPNGVLPACLLLPGGALIEHRGALLDLAGHPDPGLLPHIDQLLGSVLRAPHRPVGEVVALLEGLVRRIAPTANALPDQ